MLARPGDRTACLMGVMSEAESPGGGLLATGVYRLIFLSVRLSVKTLVYDIVWSPRCACSMQLILKNLLTRDKGRTKKLY